MEILQIVGFALLAAVFIILLKEEWPSLALLLGMAAGLLIFLFLVDYIRVVVLLLEDLVQEAGLNLLYLDTIIKVVGIAYIAQFGSQICRDAGVGVLAAKVEFAGKILIIILAMPLMVAILEMVISLLP